MSRLLNCLYTYKVSSQCFILHVGILIITYSYITVGLFWALLVVLTSDFFLLTKCPHTLALYAKQFLEIKIFTFDYHENKSQRTVD